MDLLSFAYFWTVVLTKVSNSSIDSGTGSGAGGGGAGGAAMMPDCGVARVSLRAGTPCGSSIVESAMSSRRAVAASSLFIKLAACVAELSGRYRSAGSSVLLLLEVLGCIATLSHRGSYHIPFNQGCKVVHIVGSHGGQLGGCNSSTDWRIGL